MFKEFELEESVELEATKQALNVAENVVATAEEHTLELLKIISDYETRLGLPEGEQINTDNFTGIFKSCSKCSAPFGV